LIFGGDGDLPPNGTNRDEHLMFRTYEKMGYDLEDYQVEDMEFIWTNVQVAY
jgi:hypothetical protein